jgi:membrane fusion protein, multidrug efflux system
MSEQTPNTEASRDGAWREWTAIGVGLTGLLAIVAVIISLVALSGSSKTTTTVERVAVTASTPVAAPQPLDAKMVVKTDTEHGKKGPDGQWHDAILGGNLKVTAGQTVTVTVTNYDDAPHSYTSPALGLNVTIPGGGATKPHTVKFTFKAPSKAGSYEWFCAMPCDPWAMSHDGFMRGHVTVVA